MSFSNINWQLWENVERLTSFCLHLPEKRVKTIKKICSMVKHCQQALSSLHMLPITSPKDHSPLKSNCDLFYEAVDEDDDNIDT